MSTFYASFGSSKTGLATVEYAQIGLAGAVVEASTITGVYEVGGGVYGVDVVLNPAALSLLWNTGEGTPIFAHASLQECLNQEFLIKLLRNKRITDPVTGIQTIYNDDDATPLVAGPVWEDTAGSVPYSATSEGIDRQDRLV
jgi:hypothetical protein